MACNFVRLLTRVPHIHKDKFFDRFHSIMANSVFAAFRVALPESEELFDDKFRSDLCRLSAYWTTGADIGPSNFVLPNGQVVKEDTGRDQVEAVIQQLVREQAERALARERRPKRRRAFLPKLGGDEPPLVETVRPVSILRRRLWQRRSPRPGP